jgi:hypothetical protein
VDFRWVSLVFALLFFDLSLGDHRAAFSKLLKKAFVAPVLLATGRSNPY